MVTSHTRGADEAGMLRSSYDRRRFLQWSGTASAALLLGCDNSTGEPDSSLSPSTSSGATVTAGADSATINLGNDVGILNFAYALEQLEAAFYIKVVNDFYPGASGEEREMLLDIKNHEVVHREFFQAALRSAALPKLSVDFSSVNFASRDSVLATARALEDTGVGAYNGAGQFLRNGDYLEVAGKIVSVEARHASAIRDLVGRSFAPKAFDDALTFEQVLRRAGPFIATNITITNSPTAAMATRSSGEEIDS